MTKPSSLSTNTTRAPVATIAPTVAMNVLGVVMTSSPGPTPDSSSGSRSASVPVPLDDREVAFAVSERAADRLEMNWYRIVNRRPDTHLLEMAAKRVALIRLDDVRVVHRTLGGLFVRDSNAGEIAEPLPVRG